MRFALTLGLAAAIAALPSFAQSRKDPDAAGIAEAIRFEKAKQAAADRQARIEAARANGTANATDADRAAPQSKLKAKPVRSAAARKTAAHNPQ